MVIVMTQGNYLGWPLYVNQANNMMTFSPWTSSDPELKVDIEMAQSQIHVRWPAVFPDYALYQNTL